MDDLDSFAFLRTQGFRHEDARVMAAAGITTAEGLALLRAGHPADWVSAWEAGQG